MNIILTGSTGFMGSRILPALERQGHSVLSIPSELLRGDISEHRFDVIRRLIDKNTQGGSSPGAIVHTAAISSIPYSEEYPEESLVANVKLPVVMAKLANIYKCAFISCSSDQVYSGNMGILPHAEDEINLSPSNTYGRHKLEAEERLLDINPSSVSLRLTWMYDMPAWRVKTNRNFVLALLLAAVENKSLSYSTNEFRGITYVRTVAENIQNTFCLSGGVYNYGSENTLDMYSTACRFMQTMGLADRIPELIRKTDSARPNLSMNCAKLRSNGIDIEATSMGIEKLVSDYNGYFR